VSERSSDQVCGNLPYGEIDVYGGLPYSGFEICAGRRFVSPTLKAAVRSKRLEIRATPEQKRLIERAARIRGTSVTDFVVSKLQEAALEVVRETESLRLREEDRKTFFNAPMYPPAPNKYARGAVARYKKRVRG